MRHLSQPKVTSLAEVPKAATDIDQDKDQGQGSDPDQIRVISLNGGIVGGAACLGLLSLALETWNFESVKWWIWTFTGMADASGSELNPKGK